MLDYQAENLILHFVTKDDLSEVARTWPSDHHPLSDTEAQEAVAYMQRNYERNTKGCIRHLSLAVCGKEHPGTIMGWCGLDGSRNPAEPELFILLAFSNRLIRRLPRVASSSGSSSSPSS